MARLVGVDLPRDKRVEIALTYIFGIGRTRAQQTLDRHRGQPGHAGPPARDEELVKLRDCIEANYQIEGDLRREVPADIRRKVEIGSYQGRRHRSGLPVRGQRTHTNARPARVPSARSPARRRSARSSPPERLARRPDRPPLRSRS